MGFEPESGGRRQRKRLGIAVTIFTLLFIVLMARFFYLQILHGEDYRQRARISFIGHERIPARRGLIRDRHGTVLATNAASYHLTITPHYVSDPDDRADTLDRLTELLGLAADERVVVEERIAEAFETGKRWEPIVVRRNLVGHVCPSTEEMEDAAAFGKDIAAISPELLDCKKGNLATRNEVAVIRSQLHKLSGVELKTEFVRKNPFHYDAAHSLGYMSYVTAEIRKEEPGVYGLTDRVGRTGAERAFEKELRGEPGEALYIKGSRGKRLDSAAFEGLDDVEFRRSQAGHDVYLSIDMNLQLEVRQAFRFYGKSGAAVVVDPRTGEVLASYSKPGFDPNEWSDRVTTEVFERVSNNPYSPMVNKALTDYHPGSVYKIVTALAGLHERVVTPDLTFHCPGHYDFGGRRFHCHNRSGHGPVDVVEALKYSCDVYFYKLGEQLGMDRLAKYGHIFGYGEPTGVALGERTGVVPTKQYHAEETELGWQPGFTLSTAIGQGALTSSPLQVARSYVALANGGSLLNLRFTKQFVDEHGDVVRSFYPEVHSTLPFSPAHMALVREGLVRVVNDPDGTAHEVALDSIVMAGKTGTAEAREIRAGADPEMARWLREDHAWFAAYAPAEDPQVVVVVFVEHGGSGSQMAAPVAQRIIKAWMRLGMHETADARSGGGGTDEGEAEPEREVQ